MVLNHMINCDHTKTLNLDVSETRVYFYDFKNKITKDFPIMKAAQGILSIPNFDKKKKLFINVSGFTSTINGKSETLIRKTFENFPNSYLIMIDHSYYTNNKDGTKGGYERSVKHVYYIGQQLAQMLVDLHKVGISAKNVHCIGHSLGSQILGYTGQHFSKATGQKIWRITALDPAGPCFQDASTEEQVRSGVAEHVEVYHCNKRGFGTTSDIGDVNFYINNGKSQPGCGTPLLPLGYFSAIAAKCNHSACFAVWLSSVGDKNRYPAYECDKYKHFKNNECKDNKKTVAGFWNPGTARGVYYFSTENYKFD